MKNSTNESYQNTSISKHNFFPLNKKIKYAIFAVVEQTFKC